LRLASYPFGHGHSHRLADGNLLVDSYHCSRYNTQTGRLTGEMFTGIFQHVSKLVEPRAAKSSEASRYREVRK